MTGQRSLRHGRALSIALGIALCGAGLALGHGQARAAVDVHIDIGNAPPPPRFAFHVRPREVYDAPTHVWVVTDPGVDDEDMFRYGGFYWVFRDGYWYRASTWRGRFVVVAPRAVPVVLYRVPEPRWKHRPSGPPGLANKPGHMPPGQYKKLGGDEGGGRGHGRGHGR